MKKSMIWSFFAAYTLAGSALEPRQEGGHDMGKMGGSKSNGGGGMGGMGGIGGLDLSNPYLSSVISSLLKLGVPILPKMKLNRTEELTPTLKRAGVRRTKFWYGPLKIDTVGYKLKHPNKMGLDPQGTSYYTQALKFPTDISILYAKTFAAKENGSPAQVSDGMYNHHIVFADSSKKPPNIVACPGAKAGASMPLSIFASAGQEGGDSKYTTNNDSLQTGFYVGKNDGVFLTAEIVNYTNTTKTAFALLEMEYIPGKVDLDTGSEAISVTQCDGSGTGIKPKAGETKFNTTSKEMAIQLDGYLFAVRGHLHDGGDSIRIIINDKLACESKASYAAKTNGAQWETIKGMSECDEAIKITRGDRLRIEARYDLDSHPARAHAGGGLAEEMGIANLQFARQRNGVKRDVAIPFDA